MDEITAANERLLAEVFSEEFVENRLVTLEDMVNRSNNITDSFMKQGACDSSFPTLDGSCNHPSGAGRSMQPYKRLVPADYCDGKQAPRCNARKGTLPSERTISLALKRAGPPKPSQEVTFAFTTWGQFITHDIIQTPDVGNGDVPCNCSKHPSCKNIPIDRRNEPVLEFPCMFVIRSSSKLGQQNGQPVREQVNQLSSFIDGTTLYGFTTKHKNMLLAPDRMHLRMNHSGRLGDTLPTVRDIRDKDILDKFQTAAVFNDKGHPEPVAGDTRVLENPETVKH